MKMIPTILSHFMNFRAGALAALALTTLATIPAKAGDQDDDFRFDLIRSKALAPNVIPKAHGRVRVQSVGPVEIMEVKVWGLPPNTDFDFFVTQIPAAPFGLAWYQGDIETNRWGVGYGRFVGRFNIETFIVSNGVVASPIVFNNAFPDVSPGPKTGPIHTYHLGLWFNNPQDAIKAGAPGTVTAFNGEHNAGVQALNTGDFPDLAGPLIKIKNGD